MRILFTGGGTGGHITPIVAVIRQLKQANGKFKMYFLGPTGEFRNILEKEGIKIKKILAGKLRRYFSMKTITDFLKMPIGFLQTIWYLYIWMPDVIFSKGGYGSVPVVFIGWVFHIPILIHESDTIPGLANRLTSVFSKKLAISFESTKKYFPGKKTALVGTPIRLRLVQTCLSTDPEDKNRARNILGITTEKPIIFILGGSQGAMKINNLVLRVLPELLDKYEVIHQPGIKNYQDIEKRVLAVRRSSLLPRDYHIFPFLEEDQMACAYLLADLVISRAGATSIAEINACGKPSILVPLPKSASDHQRKNAFASAAAGAAVVLEQPKSTSHRSLIRRAAIVLEEPNLTPNLFINEINKLFDNPETTQKMAANAKNFSRPDAAQKIAQELIEMGM